MKCINYLRFASSKTHGFTLIELMIVVAIVAILAAISFPAYSSYITKSEIRSAQADLMALSLSLENQYQRTLAYPVIGAADMANLDKIKEKFKTWNPGNTTNFSIEFEASELSGYTIIAKGVAGTRQAGCKLSLNQLNERTSSGCKHIPNGQWL